MSEVGDTISVANARWSFGGSVPETFDNHVGRSVPQYQQGHGIVVALSDFFIRPGSRVYELGCSTGELTRKMAEANSDRHVSFIGLEIEPAMVEAAKRKTSNLPRVEIREADIIDAELEPADLIVAYYTIQFVQPAVRQLLFNKIYNSLNWGGGFLLFEKVRAPDARFQDMMSSLYVDFKLQQGFTEQEIVNKSRSLKGILEPFSTQGNIDLMQRAGFVDIMTVFKHLCFEGFLAIK
ncbi:MAG: methyltransferase domain-containing protein [Coleofasciculus sp. B1-GNL1-01]|uniref:methyltransferase n=1 Tax=Coleofasciculus sp. B1-GNL1-01 TaxID=3068484 RepID=UPI0032FBD4E5